MTTVTWRTPSRSHGGQCVEVGAVPGGVGVRDTKDRAGGTLAVSRAEWSRFLGAVKAGQYHR